MKRKIVSLSFLLILLVSASGQVIYVKANATGANNGTSWANAYTTLQQAITAATSVNQIWVAKGTYKPTIEVGGTGDRYKTFQMKSGVAIYGGFAGAETATNQRSNYSPGKANETILSGDIGTAGVNADNCYHVIYNSEGLGLTATAVLDGFTISGGNANHDSDNLFLCGGGMLNYSCSPSIINCTFKNNEAINGGGGGILNYMSSPTLSNCTFSENSAQTGGGVSNFMNSTAQITNCIFSSNSAHYGGGLQNYGSSATITGCTFNGNTTTSNGGGIENENSSSTITNCTFTGNTVLANGGGIENINSLPIIDNCTFVGNSASIHGGGIFNDEGSSAAISKSIFRGNSAVFYGGGMFNDNNSSPNIINCVFNCNTANFGGGIDNSGSSPILVNCTFSGNSAGSKGGAMDNDASSAPVVRNTIFWGDYKIGDLSVSEINGGTVSNFTNCCIQDGSVTFSGMGNIFINPAFVDADGVDNTYGTSDDNFALLDKSPCIGAGKATGAPVIDILGNTRGNPPDMGAYENSLNARKIKIIYVKVNAAGSNNGTSWDNGYTSLQTALNEALMHDQIWVAKGTYKPSSPYDLTLDGNRDFHFRMINDVSIYGGFAGTETNTNQRMNWGAGQVNETILSGDIGSTGVASDNCCHVFYHPEELALNNTAKLDGFTITGGYADYSGPGNTHEFGAGIYNYKASPSITNCTFTGNQSNRNGGGMCNEKSSEPILTNCTFTGNTANNGGGIYNDHSLPGLFNCFFIGNHASLGGGIHNYYSSMDILNCTFKNNPAYEGGGIFNDNSSPTVLNSLFTGNTSSYGGGMFNLNLSNSTLINCTFASNQANDLGGGVQIDYTSASIIQNCIFWGNSAVNGGKQIYVNDGSITISNCCYANGTGDIQTNGTGAVHSTGNVFSNPLFVNASIGNYHLSAGSPCLNTGINPALGNHVPTTDMDGNVRPIGSGTDMGVYEYYDNIILPTLATFVLTNEGGLINKFVEAGYRDSSLYDVLIALQPTSGGVISDEFLAKLRETQGSDAFTAELFNFADPSNNPIGIAENGSLIVAPIYGKDFYKKDGWNTYPENPTRFESELFTYAISPQYYFDAGAQTQSGITFYYKAFAIAWAMEDTFSVTTTTLNIASIAGSTASFNITSNTNWTISSNQPWLTVNPASGVGNGTVTVTGTANSTVSERTATVTISAPGVASQTITVTQAAAAKTLSVTQTTLDVAATAGSTANFSITSNTSWSAISDKTWLTVNPVSGTGNRSVTLTVEANPLLTTRSAIVTVSAASIASKTINVTQAAAEATLSVSTTNLSVASASGSTATFNVTSNINWTASSNQTWLTVNPVSGTGNGIVIVTAEENPSATERTAVVTVSATDVASQTITVTQITGVATLSVSITSLNVAAAEGSNATFEVTSNITWSASSNQTWLSISPTTGTGNGTLTVTSEINPTVFERIAIVTVSANGLASKTVTATQAGAAAILLVSTSSLDIGAIDGSISSFDVTSNTTWSASSNQTWLTINPASGIGNGAVTLAAGANPLATERTAVITVSATGATSQNIAVSQAAMVGITNKNIAAILVYPNPFDEGFYVNTGNIPSIVSVFDIRGRLIFTRKITGIEFIPAGKIKNGIYMIELTNDQGIIRKKLIKK